MAQNDVSLELLNKLFAERPDVLLARCQIAILPPRPSVYDWHEPTRSAPGFFRFWFEPYEWFDPIDGVPVDPRSVKRMYETHPIPFSEP